MKITDSLIWTLTGVMMLAVSGVVNADASCKDWSAAAVDPTNGKYPIEMRICDLTYGLSAYVEIRNQGGTRIALAYRIVTKDDKQRDTEIILEPGVTTRAENCQACATRHAGFKAWEILSATEAAPADKSGAVAAPLPAFMGQPANTKTAVAAPEKREVAPPSPAKPLTAAPAVATEPPKAAVAAAPVAVKEPVVVKEPVAVKEPAAEGFRAEDGTIIPWEQLPPEFRPRK